MCDQFHVYEMTFDNDPYKIPYYGSCRSLSTRKAVWNNHLENNDKLLKGRGENIWRLQITSIRRFGTTPEVRTNCIEVYGYYKDQISQIIG